MAVYVVDRHSDEAFNRISDLFYNHFCPDDWDFILYGPNPHEIESLASRLTRFNAEETKQVSADMWMTVVYHS